MKVTGEPRAVTAGRRRGWTQRCEPVSALEAALWYATHGWPVLPGAELTTHAGRATCTCGNRECAAPGAHPQTGALGQASTDASVVYWMWTLRPYAPIVLPTGSRFDVLEVPAAAGGRALHRLRGCGLPVGPVAADQDRYYFLVTPQYRGDFDERVTQLGIPELHLGYQGAGGWVILPPSKLAPSRLPRRELRWEHHPQVAAGPVPNASALLGTVAYAATRPAHFAADTTAGPAAGYAS